MPGLGDGSTFEITRSANPSEFITVVRKESNKKQEKASEKRTVALYGTDSYAASPEQAHGAIHPSSGLCHVLSANLE